MRFWSGFINKLMLSIKAVIEVCTAALALLTTIASITSSRQNGRWWLFSVNDNGIGFAQKDANQVFRPFKRLHAKHNILASGLVCQFCKRIVERHGGKIWAESKVGKDNTLND